MVLLGMLVVILSLLPMQTNALATALSSTSVYLRQWCVGDAHTATDATLCCSHTPDLCRTRSFACINPCQDLAADCLACATAFRAASLALARCPAPPPPNPQRSWLTVACRYSPTKRGRHVVVAGTFNHATAHQVIEELFHSDHGFHDRNIVFLAASPPDDGLRTALKTHRFAHRLMYVQGHPHSHKVRALCVCVHVCCFLQSCKVICIASCLPY